MNLLIYMGSNNIEDLSLGHSRVETIEPLVNARRALVVHVALVAGYSRPHALDVVFGRLLPVGIVTLKLELPCLEIVARVILVRNCQRHNVQAAQLLNHTSGASANGHHLEYCRLRAVVRVLGTPLALRNPDVVMLLFYHKMHVVGHQAAGSKSLAR